MPANPTMTATLSIRLPREEARELERLARERNVTVAALVMLQLGPLRKQLRARLRRSAPPT